MLETTLEQRLIDLEHQVMWLKTALDQSIQRYNSLEARHEHLVSIVAGEEEMLTRDYVARERPDFLWTWDLDEHPENYDKECYCETCRSYFDPY